jgi:hypothetical protein
MPLQAFRRKINKHFYLQLINHYVPSYKGTLQPLSLSELAGLQSYGENAKAWLFLHGHWRCAQLHTHAAWQAQIRQNLALLQRLVAEVQRGGPSFHPRVVSCGNSGSCNGTTGGNCTIGVASSAGKPSCARVA